MDSPYHRRPLPQHDDESDDETNPFNNPLDPAASNDRIPLTQAVSGQRPYSTTPPQQGGPYGERPGSRYTLSESYVPGAQPNLGAPGTVHFADPAGSRPGSVMSTLTDDWIRRQQPPEPSQADLRRYPTRRVRLTQGNVFSAEYAYYLFLILEINGSVPSAIKNAVEPKWKDVESGSLEFSHMRCIFLPFNSRLIIQTRLLRVTLMISRLRTDMIFVRICIIVKQNC